MNDNVAIIMYNTVCLCAFVLLALLEIKNLRMTRKNELF